MTKVADTKSLNLENENRVSLLFYSGKSGPNIGRDVSNQHLSQIDAATRDAILGNVGSLVLFRIGAQDAPLFARILEPFSSADLQNQPNHRATIWMLQQGERLRPFTAHMQPPYHPRT